ncbi:MAG: ATP-dependent RNA helicase HrpA [Actinomycetota bacterium]
MTTITIGGTDPDRRPSPGEADPGPTLLRWGRRRRAGILAAGAVMVADPVPEPVPDLRSLRARSRELTIRDRQRIRRRIDRAKRIREHGRRERALHDIAARVAAGEELVDRRRRSVPEIAYPPSLPIVSAREELLAAMRDHQVVVVAGETGSGKSTQLPKLCLELGRGVHGTIAHTQPRRIAARSIAARIADELGVERPVVASSVRFDDQATDDTLVRVMTDGLLLAEIDRDPLLRRYDTIIVDEAHERSLNVDVLLGYLARILPRRRDLSVVITSATIDTERMAAHFDAPVVSVSGRSYPVEVRYRPLEPPAVADDDETDPKEPIDQATGIAEAVRELVADPVVDGGDVLVFCSGEREITEAIAAIGALDLAGVETLPLFARLPVAEQQRVFSEHEGRRVVVATNVAETSLTVPGIRAVVDCGTARIARAGRRTKVQRLPVEPISQASAEQRAGRCGRLGPGVCIRLYEEDDLAARAPFTEPEILRTNLASVVLRLASLGIHDLSDFSFIDAPDRHRIGDAERLLVELEALDPAAVDDDRLTPLGRRLARLPLDPRLGRMVVQAEQEGCVREAIVVTAALSIVDPRERSDGDDDPHAVDREDGSDVLAWLRLWERVRTARRERSRRGFRRWCREQHLHAGRLHEWQDLVRQLRITADELGLSQSSAPDDHDAIHRSVLAGALTHVGLLDRRTGEYRGVRGARFRVARDSAVARSARWVVAAELVETRRMQGRTVARVRPEWIEELADHLVDRSWSEPAWDAERGAAVVDERVELHGLAVVRGRRVPLSLIDVEGARRWFIEHALVQGEWQGRHDVLDENRAALDEVVRVARRSRRADLLVDERELAAFYDERLGETVTSAAEFTRWWRATRRRDPDRLTLTPELILDRADVELDLAAFPDTWSTADWDLSLRYRFDQRADDDGVTVEVPVAALDRLHPETFEWHVPGWRTELIETLLRAQPKEVRRELLPIGEHAAAIAAERGPAHGALRDVVEREIGRRAGVALDREAWAELRLPPHLLVAFSVVGHDGSVLGEGRDLVALQRRHAGDVRQALAGAAASIEVRGATGWSFGELPAAVSVERFGAPVVGHPTLVDAGDAVDVEVLVSADRAERAMWVGTRRLLALAMAAQRRQLLDPLDDDHKLTVARRLGERLGAVLDDLLLASVDRLLGVHGGPVRDEVGWRRLRDAVRADVSSVALAALEPAVGLVVRADGVRARIDELRPSAPSPSLDDASRQLDRLVGDGALTRAGLDRLGDLDRYLSALDLRLDRVRGASERDLDALRSVQALELRLDDLRARFGDIRHDALEAIAWQLEELRVSLWAQRLGTAGKVSVPRIERALDEVAASIG